MAFSMIAAIGKNRELGKDGQLIWRLPGDLQFFKKTTMGHPILMGHRTFDSLPGMLPGRKHYVVTRSADVGEKELSLVLVNDLTKFVSEHADDPEEIFVIGGGMIYWEMLKYCDKLYLTEVDAEESTADTFFPEFDKNEFDREVLGEGEDGGIKYVFALYTRKERSKNEK